MHCHPPHATAYAITGRVPPSRVIPEFEVFVGKVAVSPYETPGTKAFAETVIPYVKTAQYGAAREPRHHLLGRHRHPCRVVRRSGRHLLLDADACASSSARRSRRYPRSTPQDLLNIKKTIGLPDARFDASGMKECQLSDLDTNTSIALPPCARDGVTIGIAGCRHGHRADGQDRHRRSDGRDGRVVTQRCEADCRHRNLATHDESC